MVSALGCSCLVHITRDEHQGMNNRHELGPMEQLSKTMFVCLFVSGVYDTMFTSAI